VRRLQGRRKATANWFYDGGHGHRASVHGLNYYTAVIRDVSCNSECAGAVPIAQTEAIGALASGIAHDFNNIFTASSALDLAISRGDLPAALKGI